MSESEEEHLTKLIQTIAARHWAAISVRVLILAFISTFSIISSVAWATWRVTNGINGLERAIDKQAEASARQELRLSKIEMERFMFGDRWTATMMHRYNNDFRLNNPMLMTPDSQRIQLDLTPRTP